VLALAPPIATEVADAALRRAELPDTLRLAVVSGRTHEAILAADLALAKPGTVTVEAALLARPMVVMGRVNALTAAVLRRAVTAPWYSMPNLIADREIVPELLQERAAPAQIAEALAELLEGPARAAQLEALAQVRTRLGRGGAAQAAGRIAEQLLETS
jgi:lipid-A-disaccharide synthase